MVSPTDVVKGFMAEWETDGARMRAGFRRYFTPHTVYENIGMSRSIGPEAAIALVASRKLSGLRKTA